jgi:hypothetical protein
MAVRIDQPERLSEMLSGKSTRSAGFEILTTALSYPAAQVFEPSSIAYMIVPHSRLLPSNMLGLFTRTTASMPEVPPRRRPHSHVSIDIGARCVTFGSNCERRHWLDVLHSSGSLSSRPRRASQNRLDCPSGP